MEAVKKPIKVIVVEDSPKYREAIGMAFASSGEIEITGSFGTAEGALSSLSRILPEGFPDVVLLDLNLPGISGLDAIPRFRKAAPGSGILVLTQSDKEADVFKAITGGASGYLLKSAAVAKACETGQFKPGA